MYVRGHSCNPPLQLLKLLLTHMRVQSLRATSQVVALQIQWESQLTHRVMYSSCFQSQVMGTPAVALRSPSLLMRPHTALQGCSGQVVVIRFAGCWLQPHLMCLPWQVAFVATRRVQQSRSPQSLVLRPPPVVLRPPTQLPRPLAVISRFSIYAPYSDQQVLYLPDSASYVVFVWAGGFDTCVPGAAVTQPHITTAEVSSTGLVSPGFSLICCVCLGRRL